MPLFEYTCDACAHRFESLVMGARKPSCPSCGGRRLTKLLSTFAVSSGSRDSAAPAGGCGSCGDPRGPGSCETD